ncbi:hypothetical protein CR513_13642, partial [Mucuna pruriens]
MCLPPNSIDSFEMLMMKFRAQYATSRSHHLASIALVNLCQEEDESLRSFMEHFSAVAIKIRDLNLEVAFYSMIMVLKLRLFLKNLCKRTPTSMDKLRARASGYIQMEKMAEYQDGVKAEHQATKSCKREGGESNQPIKRKNMGEKMFEGPNTRSPQGVDRSKYCHRTLRDKIEELVQKFVKRAIKQGHLRRKPETSHRRETIPNRDEPRNLNRQAKGTSRLRGVINMIASIFAGGGSTSSAKKRYLRTVNNVQLETDKMRRKLPPITFTHQDFIGVDPEQNDPMVIMAEVANFVLKKLGEHPVHVHFQLVANPKIQDKTLSRVANWLAGYFVQHSNREANAECLGSYSLHITLGHEVPFLYPTNSHCSS